MNPMARRLAGLLPRLAALLCAAPLALAAATWTVQPGQAIQPAIDRAAAGDVVEVQRGHYPGNLVIAKPLTLRGIGRPTVSGGLQGDTIRVKAPDVTIEGLIVRDSGDSLLAQNAGIYLSPGSHRAVVRHASEGPGSADPAPPWIMVAGRKSHARRGGFGRLGPGADGAAGHQREGLAVRRGANRADRRY